MRGLAAVALVLGFAIGVLVALPTGAVAGSATVNLVASKNNTLFEDPGGAASNGAGSFLYVGMGADGLRRRALVKFDLTATGLPPPPLTVVESATVRMHLHNASLFFPVPETVSVFKVLEEWGEGSSNADGTGPNGGGGEGAPSTAGDATWIHTYYPDILWVAGGHFFPSARAQVTLFSRTAAYYEWADLGLTQDVQSWLENASSNHGWVVMGTERPSAAVRFESRHAPQEDTRPTLSVTYTVSDGLGACCRGDASCQRLTPAECGAVGGTYAGDNSACGSDTCEPRGACCDNSEATCRLATRLDCNVNDGAYEGDGTSCASGTCTAVLAPFVDALPRPSIAQPVNGQSGAEATYEIAMRQFRAKFHRDLNPTIVWGYGDAASPGASIPGPTIEARSDQMVTVNWINDLRDDSGGLLSDHYLPVDPCPHGIGINPDHAPRTVVHLHGAHVRSDSDGFPENTFLPGQSAIYHYPNTQFPTTLWYHDHSLGETRLNVYMGLAAFYLIRDDTEAELGLPSGEFEMPLMIMDRSFRPDGSLVYPRKWTDHFFGDTIVVNGKAWPYLTVKQGLYRFRIVNASNSRTYTLALPPEVPIRQIGSDGGLLSVPTAPLASITMAPAERVDVIVDFRNVAAGTNVVLTNSAPTMFPVGSAPVGPLRDVMQFRVQGLPGFVGPIPQTLRAVAPLHESDAVGPPRDFELSAGVDPEHCGMNTWFIKSIQNGIVRGMHWDEINEYPRLGTTEVWRFFNRSEFTHAMHIHLVQAQLLDRSAFTVLADGSLQPTGTPMQPLAGESGWKDTFQVPPGTVTRVIMRFTGYSGRYSLHCHLLEHEDNEMMRQFHVTECGNGIAEIEAGEQCDDGNTTDGDCCSSTCQLEPDGNACVSGATCTAGTCGGGHCVGSGTPVSGIPCDDLNPCTTGDTCAAGVCVGTPVSGIPCDDRSVCTLNDTCSDGVCVSNPAIACNDDNACTSDTCDPSTGCEQTSAITCDDGNPCTIDSCDPVAGSCLSVPIHCDDHNGCTTDACDPATGCVFANNTNPCDDGSACTTGDTCGSGACHPGSPVICQALDQCHDAGVCDSATGVCSNPIRPDGTTCDDGSLCTRGDDCRAGVCTPSYSGLNRPSPRTSGYYQLLCARAEHGYVPNRGDRISDADALCVGGLTPEVNTFRTAADLCAVLDGETREDRHSGGRRSDSHDCVQAENELIATALNICRARVCEAQDVDPRCGPNSRNVTETTVAGSFGDAIAILDNPNRTTEMCRHAGCELREINNGHALETNSDAR